MVWGQTMFTFHSWLLVGLRQEGAEEGLEKEEGTCLFLFFMGLSVYFLFL